MKVAISTLRLECGHMAPVPRIGAANLFVMAGHFAWRDIMVTCPKGCGLKSFAPHEDQCGEPR